MTAFSKMQKIIGVAMVATGLTGFGGGDGGVEGLKMLRTPSPPPVSRARTGPGKLGGGALGPASAPAGPAMGPRGGGPGAMPPAPRPRAGPSRQSNVVARGAGRGIAGVGNDEDMVYVPAPKIDQAAATAGLKGKQDAAGAKRKAMQDAQKARNQARRDRVEANRLAKAAEDQIGKQDNLRRGKEQEAANLKAAEAGRQKGIADQITENTGRLGKLVGDHADAKKKLDAAKGQLAKGQTDLRAGQDSLGQIQSKKLQAERELQKLEGEVKSGLKRQEEAQKVFKQQQDAVQLLVVKMAAAETAYKAAQAEAQLLKAEQQRASASAAQLAALDKQIGELAAKKVGAQAAAKAARDKIDKATNLLSQKGGGGMQGFHRVDAAGLSLEGK